MLYKRLALLCLIVLMLVPMQAGAQENESRWNLVEPFTVTDLGFSFLFPEGWVWEAEDGIVIAENGDDLAIARDTDTTTFPKGVVIQLISQDLEALGFDAATATLDEVVTALIDASSMTVEEQFDLPVMTRRTVSLFGTFPDTSAGIATLWLQGEQVVIFEFYAPTAEIAQDYAFSWGQLLSTVMPEGSLPLIEKPYLIESDNTNIRYPEGWEILNEAMPFTVGDTSAESTGYGLFTVRGDSSEFTTVENPTLDDILVVAREALAIEETRAPREFILFEQPAIALYGTSEEGTLTEAIITLIGSDVYMIAHGAPTDEAMATFEPTWLAILQSLELLDAPAQ